MPFGLKILLPITLASNAETHTQADQRDPSVLILLSPAPYINVPSGLNVLNTKNVTYLARHKNQNCRNLQHVGRSGERQYVTVSSSKINKVPQFCCDVVQKVSYSLSKRCPQDVALSGCEPRGHEILDFGTLGYTTFGIWVLGCTICEFFCVRARNIWGLRF